MSPAREGTARLAVVSRAVHIASVEGLEGLSIGRLAADMQASKSGIFGLFGSKELLQLAVVETAVEVFTSAVVIPGLSVPPGVGQVVELYGAWIEHSRKRVFPGGCFFYNTAAEFDARPGPVRDALAKARRDWLNLCTQAIRDAQRLGEITPGCDPAQLAFEFDAFVAAANGTALLLDDPGAYDRARTAIRERLRTVTPEPNEGGE